MEEYVVTLPNEEVKVLRPVAKRFGWGVKKLCENFDFTANEGSISGSVSYVVNLPQDDVEFLSLFAEKAKWDLIKGKS